MRLAGAISANRKRQKEIELQFFGCRLAYGSLLIISKNFDEFANQNALLANFRENAAKNRANLKGDSYECNPLFCRFICSLQ